MDIQTLYLYGLILGGSITLLYMLFGDVFDAMGHIAPGSILNPTVVLSFISVLCGAGYILELHGQLTSTTILVISTLISLVIVGCIHFFILVPLSKSEQSTAFSIEDFIGQEGEVITTIPVDGFGEVIISSNFGINGNAARSTNNTEIKEGMKIKVVGYEKNGVLLVEPART